MDNRIVRLKKRLDGALQKALSDFAVQRTDKGSADYGRGIERITREYQNELRRCMEEEIGDRISEVARSYGEVAGELSKENRAVGEWMREHSGKYFLSDGDIRAVGQAGSRVASEMELIGRLLDAGVDIGPIRGGKLSFQQYKRLLGLLNDPQAARRAGVDLHQWRQEVYGNDAFSNSADLFAGGAEQALVKEDYVTQNTLGQQIPEIIGYRVEVSPANKYGAARKKDICDELAGDYPKGFVFTGWHYNCRCKLHPLVERAYLTPALAAKGFIGVDPGTKITVPQAARQKILENLPQYRASFPALAEANIVQYRGKQRFLADFDPEEYINYYVEQMGRQNGPFLQGASGVDVKTVKPKDKEVLMDTRLTGDRYAMNVSDVTAADGHNPARDLIGAFKKSNTGIPLTREELSAASDITHEMVHTMSKDYSFAELESRYPQRRDELLDFNLYSQSPQRQALEMVTEWYSRKVFPDVAKNQGWALPEGFEKSIGTGYVDMVANLDTFLEYAGDGDAAAARMAEILRRPDKAFAYRYLADIIRESNVLKSGRKPETLLQKMLTAPPHEFSRYLSEAARPKATETPVPVVLVAVTAVAGEQATRGAAALKAEEELARLGFDAKGTAKRLAGGLDGVKKNALIDVRAASVLRGLGYVARPAAILAPIGIATNAYEEAQRRKGQPQNTPDNGLPQRNHYLNPEVYKGKGYAAALTAGLFDSAVELAAWPIKTVAGILKYGGYAIAKGLTLQPIPDGPVKEALKSAGQKADAINASAAEFGQELAEFLYYYQTDPQFKRLFDLQMSAEVYQYYQHVRGTSEAQGYEQGRMLGDIIALLLTTGGLKKLLTSWKRLKTFSLKEYLPTTKNLQKAEKKLLDGSVKTMMNIHPKQLPPALDNRLPGVEIKSGPHKIIETINGVKIQTNQKNYGYIPDINNFKPKPGMHCDPQTVPQIKRERMQTAVINNRRNSKDVIDEYISSSRAEPRIISVIKPLSLYKIVKSGERMSEQTGYFVTSATLQKVVQMGQVEQSLALPLMCNGELYDVYQITARPEYLRGGITIFESEIAPTIEGAYETIGGVRQIFVPDRGKFKEQGKIMSFKYKKR